ncbi:hypothetical protein [Thalassovita sp.]|uniref:hypothetical protein n=1 Tax=Thalassovita sp. TaxID=1979401 RepID=UPI0029DE83E4|nr:hypothetical protein [Thalassovita sp.]
MRCKPAEIRPRDGVRAVDGGTENAFGVRQAQDMLDGMTLNTTSHRPEGTGAEA